MRKKTYATPFVKDTRTGIVKDYSGNGNNATLDLTTTPRWVNSTQAGRESYYFDGVNDIISSGNVLNVGTSNFTVSVWAKFGTSTYNWQRLFGKKAVAGTSAGYSIYYNGSTKKLMWSAGNGTVADEYWTNSSFTGSGWYHIVMIRNNSDSRKGYFYVNGVREEISTIPTILDTNTTEFATMGAQPTGLLFNGYIDDVRIYNRALSANEILQLYNSTK